MVNNWFEDVPQNLQYDDRLWSSLISITFFVSIRFLSVPSILVCLSKQLVSNLINLKDRYSLVVLLLQLVYKEIPKVKYVPLP